MSEGWFADIADADAYFADERLETSGWDSLQPARKTKVARMAYNRIYYDPRWTGLPTYATATPAELVKLRIANAEMAYYLAVHLEDEDVRKGLQAQAVIEETAIKEKYSEAALMDLPVPPAVIAILSPWSVDGPFIAVCDMGRDEERKASAKVGRFR